MDTKDFALDLRAYLFALRDDFNWPYFVLNVRTDNKNQWIEVMVDFQHKGKDYNYIHRITNQNFSQTVSYLPHIDDIINRIKKDVYKL